MPNRSALSETLMHTEKFRQMRTVLATPCRNAEKGTQIFFSGTFHAGV